MPKFVTWKISLKAKKNTEINLFFFFGFRRYYDKRLELAYNRVDPRQQ